MSGGGAFKIIWDLFRARIKIMSIKSRKEVRCQFLILCLYLYLSRLGCLIIDASSFPIKSSCCYSHTGTLHKHVHFNFALIDKFSFLPFLCSLAGRKVVEGEEAFPCFCCCLQLKESSILLCLFICMVYLSTDC